MVAGVVGAVSAVVVESSSSSSSSQVRVLRFRVRFVLHFSSSRAFELESSSDSSFRVRVELS